MILIFFLLLNSPVDRFSESIEKIKNFETEFFETVNYPEFEPTTFTGKIYILRPHYFRMEVDSPSKQLLIVNGKNAWLYLEEENIVYRRKASDFLENASIFLLSSEFKIIFQGEEDGGKFLLIPEKEVQYDSLKITVDKVNYWPRRILIFSKDGTQMDFTFQRMKVNTAISKNLFLFKPPPHVEIIGD